MTTQVPALTARLARSGGRSARLDLVLAAGAAALAAFAMLALVSVALGSSTRAERTEWRNPVPAQPSDTATARQAVSTSFYGQDPVVVVHLADLDAGPAPVPPGMQQFPAPGTVAVSPALARVLGTDEGRAALARRLPVDSQSEIATTSLASPDELLAVVGTTPDDPVFDADSALSSASTAVTPANISAFDGSVPSLFVRFDAAIALIGVGLLAMPLVVLASTTGRLGAARRERRLAGLRLAGATPAQVAAMTAIESGSIGVVGSLAGAAMYLAALPVLALVPFGVGAWEISDLFVGLPILVAVLATVVGLAVISSVSALRSVIQSPMGAAQMAEPRHTGLLRLALSAALLTAVAVGARSTHGDTVKVVAVVTVAYGAFWILGPGVVDRMGRLMARAARRPAMLLAARRLSDDPRSAWRTVSGLVLAGFIVGFFTVGNAAVTGYHRPQQIAFASVPSDAIREARTRLSDAAIVASVRRASDDIDSLPISSDGMTVDVDGGRAQLDRAVTALWTLTPGQPPLVARNYNADVDSFSNRLKELGNGLLAISFLAAAASCGLGTAANVIERRSVLTRLRMIGTPLRTIHRARTLETLVPLCTLVGSTVGAGIYAASKLNHASGGDTVDSASVVRLAVACALGLALVIAAINASRLLVRSLTDDTESAFD